MSEEKHLLEKGILSEPPLYQPSPSDTYPQETYAAPSPYPFYQPPYGTAYPGQPPLTGYPASGGWTYPPYPLYPIVSPCDLMMVVRPAVKHGLQGLDRSDSPKKTLNETAMMAYLMGAGFDARSAEYLVESWEIGDMPWHYEKG